jgi:hypothetical protein
MASMDLPKAKKETYTTLWEKAPDDEIGDLIAWMYEGHLEMYGADEKWEIVAVEHNAQIWLPTSRGGRSNFKLKMKIDLVVRERDGHKRLWLLDHKSGGRLPYGVDLDLDEQFGLYTWGMRQLGHPVFGQIHDGARTQRNKGPMELEERFRRTLMSRTDKEITNAAVDAWRTASNMYARKKWEYKRNYNTDTCSWRCDYREACLWGRKIGEDATRSFLRDTGFRQDFTRH